MLYHNLINTHKKDFLKLLEEKNISLQVGYYSKPFTLKLSNKIVTFRFQNLDNNKNYKIVLNNNSSNYKYKNSFIKNNHFFIYDKVLNIWLKFKKELIFKSLQVNKDIPFNNKSYLKMAHALSDTEKEAIALGKDVRVFFNMHCITTHKVKGQIEKNITADYSFFLGKNSLPISLKKISNDRHLNIGDNNN